MSKNTPVPTHDSIVQRIFEIRGQRVMLDSDLAALYWVDTGALVRAGKRNLGRFPNVFGGGSNPSPAIDSTFFL